MGCCWTPHYVLTFSLFVPVFSWQLKLNCWSVHGASLPPFERELFYLCQEMSPIPHKVSKIVVNSSEFAPGFSRHTLQWFFSTPSWFENNNPHSFSCIRLCWLPCGSCTFQLKLKQFNVKHSNVLGIAHPQPSFSTEDQTNTSPSFSCMCSRFFSSSISFLVPSSFCALAFWFCPPRLTH